jgi:hypothetical protein
VCAQQPEHQQRCNDGNDCSDDACGATPTYANPNCVFTNDDSNPCHFNDNDPCTDGVCVSGVCQTHEMSPGSTCDAVLTGTQCEIKTCDANGVCVDSGQSINCTGTLGVCRQWSCSLVNGTPTCSQVNAGTDLQSAVNSGCETNTWDCKRKRCNAKGNCVTTAEAVNYFCDPNHTSPELTDCVGGQCDSRKNCLNDGLTAGPFDGQECSDGHTCTIATCSNGTCTAATTCHGPERTCPGCPGVACDPNQTVANNNCNCAN